MRVTLQESLGSMVRGSGGERSRRYGGPVEIVAVAGDQWVAITRRGKTFYLPRGQLARLLARMNAKIDAADGVP